MLLDLGFLQTYFGLYFSLVRLDSSYLRRKVELQGANDAKRPEVGYLNFIYHHFYDYFQV